MPNNNRRYGFRFHSTQRGGGGRPACFEGILVSGYQATIGVTPVGVSIGDPVLRLASGAYEVFGDSIALDRHYGVVMGIANFKGANGRCTPVSYYPPGGTTYSTEAETTRLLIAPFADHIWEIDSVVTPAVSTLAQYRDLMGTNADFLYDITTVPSDKPRVNPYISVEGLLDPDLAFRLVDVSETAENVHFDGNYVKLLVQLNQGSDPRLGTAGVDGL